MGEKSLQMNQLMRDSSPKFINTSISKNNPIKEWAEDLNRQFSKEEYRWPKNTWKDVQHHSLLEKCTSKPLWGTTLHQPEWPSSKTLQIVSAGEGVEKKEPYYTVGGIVNWCNPTVESSMEMPQKTKHRTTIWSSNFTPGHLPRENHDLKRHIYSNVHCSTIHSSEDMETT